MYDHKPSGYDLSNYYLTEIFDVAMKEHEVFYLKLYEKKINDYNYKYTVRKEIH
jgi:hypothetical protein